MIDDEDEFAKVSIFAEHLLREIQSLTSCIGQNRQVEISKILRYRSVVDPNQSFDHSKLSWHKITRNFLVKYDREINEAIRAALPS